MDYRIEAMKPEDWMQVAAIYWEGIQTKIATFQAEIPSWEQWDHSHSSTCRLVAKANGVVLGWTALTPISSRCVYAGVADVSIYVGERYKRQGVGEALLTEIIRQSEAEGYWSLQSGIIRENVGSQTLHAKCGFRMVGFREKLGRMDNGKWHDVLLMERRSRTEGI